MSSSTDALSEVLRAVRMTGARYLVSDAPTSWDEADENGPPPKERFEHFMECHAIVEGECWGRRLEEAPIRLHPGDLICFPRGDVSRIVPEDWTKRARVVRGLLGLEREPFSPLLASLPRTLHLPRAADDAAVKQLLWLAVEESSFVRPGAQAVLARLSELLFVAVVRNYVERLPPGQGGWLGGIRDETVGRALAKLHERPAHDWTLSELARAAGASRSALAERFTHFVGIPPMQYLARWRVQLAAGLLATSALGISEIAERVGYGSETTLGRAFKRGTGVVPSAWRRGERGATR